MSYVASYARLSVDDGEIVSVLDGRVADIIGTPTDSTLVWDSHSIDPDPGTPDYNTQVNLDAKRIYAADWSQPIYGALRPEDDGIANSSAGLSAVASLTLDVGDYDNGADLDTAQAVDASLVSWVGAGWFQPPNYFAPSSPPGGFPGVRMRLEWSLNHTSGPAGSARPFTVDLAVGVYVDDVAGDVHSTSALAAARGSTLIDDVGTGTQHIDMVIDGGPDDGDALGTLEFQLAYSRLSSEPWSEARIDLVASIAKRLDGSIVASLGDGTTSFGLYDDGAATAWGSVPLSFPPYTYWWIDGDSTNSTGGDPLTTCFAFEAGGEFGSSPGSLYDFPFDWISFDDIYFGPYPPWNPDPLNPVSEYLGIFYVRPTPAIVHAKAEMILPMVDPWSLPTYPDPFVGDANDATTIPDGQGIRQERWAVLQIDPYVVTRGQAVGFPQAIVELVAEVGIGDPPAADTRPDPSTYVSPLPRRWVAGVDFVEGTSWTASDSTVIDLTSDAPVGGVLEFPVSADVSVSRPTVHFDGTTWLVLPGEDTPAFTVLLAAQLKPGIGAFQTLLHTGDPRTESSPSPGLAAPELRLARDELSVRLPVEVTGYRSTDLLGPSLGSRNVAIALSLDTVHHVGRLHAIGARRVSRYFYLPAGYLTASTAVQVGFSYFGLGKAQAVPTIAKMELFEVGMDPTTAYGEGQMQDLLAVVDAMYGISG